MNSRQPPLLQHALKIIFFCLMCLGKLTKTEKKNDLKNGDLSVCFYPKPCFNSHVVMFLNLTTNLSKKLPGNPRPSFKNLKMNKSL